ncbi:unnamed protein product, partial [Tetraodon nigroviridis]
GARGAASRPCSPCTPTGCWRPPSGHRRAGLLQQPGGGGAVLALPAAADAHQPAAAQHQPERPAGVAARGQLHLCRVRAGALDLEPGHVRLGRFQQQPVR